MAKRKKLNNARGKAPVKGSGQDEIASMIRVNQAGEYGAKRIYAGQLAIMGDRADVSGSIAHMAEQEERHLSEFNAMVADRGVRPTALQPIWDVAGFALGAVRVATIGPAHTARATPK